MKNKLLNIALATLLFGAISHAKDIKNTVIPTKHNKNLTIEDIAEIQPGLGTVMIEFGHRFYITYYAAKAGNWKLAEYELEELIEAQEVAEVTRPKYKKQLKDFEDDYLEKLEDAIEDKNFTKFEKLYTKTTKACNRCHKANGHPYIKYILPKNPPKFLDMHALTKREK
jgi:hypothetical protein